MTILALDYGAARIGMAATSRLNLPLPIGTLEVKKLSLKDQVAKVINKIQEREARCVLIGLPLHLDGKPSAQTKATETFIAALKEALERIDPTIKVETIDERLSSKQAEQQLREAGAKRRERDGRCDETSAWLLLDAYVQQQR